MNNRFAVSAECPSCAAPLDFTESSNAVQCMHCRTRLLVTGRKQVLTYFVKPKLNMQQAASKALALRENGKPLQHIIKSQLYFIPYYRFTGHDFRWGEKPEEQEAGIDSADDTSLQDVYDWPVSFKAESSILDLAVDFATLLKKEESVFHSELLSKTGEKPQKEVHLLDRYVEKNFIACNLGGSGLYSLGVRPSVLKLSLYHKNALEAMGRVSIPDISPENAVIRGMKAEASDSIFYRTVISRLLSVVYFPFWIVELAASGQNALVIIDAVSQTVVRQDAETAIYNVLDKTNKLHHRVAGFRPLICPNCGWDLPLRPDDAIFFCSTCRKAWQIAGDNLYETAYHIAEPRDMRKGDKLTYLPFWLFDAATKNSAPFRLFIPAFRCRRLKFIVDLAMNISKKQPAYSVTDNGKADIQGCCYDQEDALMLARFVIEGLRLKEPEGMNLSGEDAIAQASAKLICFPFIVKGSFLADPFTGFSLSQGLLL